MHMTRTRKASGLVTRVGCATLLIVAGLAITHRTQTAQGVPPRTKATGPAVRSGMLVSTNWLAERLKDPKVVVLHVARERAHYDRGHVPGAADIDTYDIVRTGMVAFAVWNALVIAMAVLALAVHRRRMRSAAR